MPAPPGYRCASRWLSSSSLAGSSFFLRSAGRFPCRYRPRALISACFSGDYRLFSAGHASKLMKRCVLLRQGHPTAIALYYQTSPPATETNRVRPGVERGGALFFSTPRGGLSLFRDQTPKIPHDCADQGRSRVLQSEIAVENVLEFRRCVSRILFPF